MFISRSSTFEIDGTSVDGTSVTYTDAKNVLLGNGAQSFGTLSEALEGVSGLVSLHGGNPAYAEDLLATDEIKETALSDLSEKLANSLAQMSGNPDAIEVASWSRKLVAADKVLAGEDYDQTILTPLMVSRGLDDVGAANFIHLKNRIFTLIKSSSDIWLSLKSAEIKAAESKYEIDGIVGVADVEIFTRAEEFDVIYNEAVFGNLSPLVDAETAISNLL